MIIKIEKPNVDKQLYVVSYPSGKKINKLEIYEGSKDWSTQGITSFLLDLSDATSDIIEVVLSDDISDDTKASDEQLKELVELFNKFASEINNK